MSYSLGTNVTEYRTDASGRLVPWSPSWWDRNRSWIIVGGVAVGGLGLIAALQYMKYKRSMALTERYGAEGTLLAAGMETMGI